MTSAHNTAETGVAEGSSLTSIYLPLHPRGALPPGLEPTIVRQVVLDFEDGKIRRRLESIGRRSAGRNRAERLKAVLSTEQGREVCENEDALYLLLYRHLRRTPAGRAVYRRLISPAEKDVESRSFLDAERFRALVEDHVCETADMEAHSEESALAGFVLAYGMLQPDDAHRLVEILASRGMGFAAYFGLGETLRQTALAVDERDGPDPPASSDLAIAEDLRPSSGCEGSARSPAEEAGAGTVNLTPNPVLSEPAGPWSLELSQLHTRLDSARCHRRDLGGMETLHADALREAIQAELQAAGENAALDQRLRSAAAEVVSELERVVSARGMRFSLPTPLATGALASWLDQTRPVFEAALEDAIELERACERLDKRIVEALGWPSIPVTNVQEAAATIRVLREHAERHLESGLEWKRVRTELAAAVADCEMPIKARSMDAVSDELLLEFVRHAHWEPEFSNALPLLLRWVGERSGWPTLAPLLSQWLAESATGRLNIGPRELIAYLPVDAFRELATCCDASLLRHLALASLEESVARDNPVFLSRVWPMPEWRERHSEVGALVPCLFDSLARAYDRDGDLSALRTALTCQADAAEAMASTRARHLAERLQTPPGMTGRHFRLRLHVHTTYEKPLVSHVLQRDHVAVSEKIAELQLKHRKGLVEREALESIGETSLPRPYAENLRRYVEEVIATVREWIALDPNQAPGDAFARPA